tara:strand:+ start:1008 stop:1190 length:183 start_codon:yes stop_codon:yes gene_type:complete
METKRSSVTVKGYGNKKHEITIEKTSMSGHISIAIKKNGNRILVCDPREFVKLKLLFSEA